MRKEGRTIRDWARYDGANNRLSQFYEGRLQTTKVHNEIELSIFI